MLQTISKKKVIPLSMLPAALQQPAASKEELLFFAKPGPAQETAGISGNHGHFRKWDR